VALFDPKSNSVNAALSINDSVQSKEKEFISNNF
jgi:hypothetical protein